MLSNKKIICPDNLINIAKKKGTINSAIVNAGEILPMESVYKAVQHNLIKNKKFTKNDNVLFIHTGGAFSLSAYEWAF